MSLCFLDCEDGRRSKGEGSTNNDANDIGDDVDIVNVGDDVNIGDVGDDIDIGDVDILDGGVAPVLLAHPAPHEGGGRVTSRPT